MVNVVFAGVALRLTYSAIPLWDTHASCTSHMLVSALCVLVCLPSVCACVDTGQHPRSFNSWQQPFASQPSAPATFHMYACSRSGLHLLSTLSALLVLPPLLLLHQRSERTWQSSQPQALLLR